MLLLLLTQKLPWHLLPLQRHLKADSSVPWSSLLQLPKTPSPLLPVAGAHSER